VNHSAPVRTRRSCGVAIATPRDRGRASRATEAARRDVRPRSGCVRVHHGATARRSSTRSSTAPGLRARGREDELATLVAQGLVNADRLRGCARCCALGAQPQPGPAAALDRGRRLRRTALFSDSRRRPLGARASMRPASAPGPCFGATPSRIPRSRACGNARLLRRYGVVFCAGSPAEAVAATAWRNAQELPDFPGLEEARRRRFRRARRVGRQPGKQFAVPDSGSA